VFSRCDVLGNGHEPVSCHHVRIQDERGHSVVSTGPYAIVRHPMYSAILLSLATSPLLLDALSAYVMSILSIVACCSADGVGGRDSCRRTRWLPKLRRKGSLAPCSMGLVGTNLHWLRLPKQHTLPIEAPIRLEQSAPQMSLAPDRAMWCHVAMRKLLVVAVLIATDATAQFRPSRFAAVADPRPEDLSAATDISMTKEDVTIDLYDAFAVFNAEFVFANAGSTRMLEVGFPRWGASVDKDVCADRDCTYRELKGLEVWNQGVPIRSSSAKPPTPVGDSPWQVFLARADARNPS